MGPNRDDDRFKAFVRNFPNGQVVEDAIRIEGLSTDFRNADFFFNCRQIIAELKTLETSRMAKIQAVIDRLRDLGELPIYFHPAPIDKIINDHPNKRKLNIQFIREIGRTLAHAFRDANQQIAQTKDKFDLTAARGILIVRNTVLPELTPEIAWNEIIRLIMKKNGSDFLYPHIDCVIYIQDVESIEIHASRFTPSLVITRENDPQLSSFSNGFLSAYANTIGIPFLDFEGDSVEILEKTSAHERFRPQRAGKKRTRSEYWQAQYLSTRTYQQLSDDELVEELARFTLEEYLVLKDGKIGPNTDKAQIERLGEKQEHLFTECEIRHIDMRLLGQKMNALLQNKSLTGDVAHFLMQRQEGLAVSKSEE